MNKKIVALLFLMFISWHGFSQNTTEDAIKRARLKYNMSLKFNDITEAKSALYDLMVLEPKKHQYIDSLAYMYFEFNQYASAALASQEALKYNPQDQVLLQIAGQSLNQLGAKDRALQMYQNLYNVSDDTFTLYEIALIQFQLKKYEDAMINTELLMGKPLIDSKVNVKNKEGEDIPVSFKAVIFNLQGMIEKERGNIDNAKKYLNSALKLAPNYSLPQENLNTIN